KPHRAVAFRAHGSGADKNDIGVSSQQVENALVRVTGKPSREAVIGGRSVDARNEVDADRLHAPVVECVAFGQLVIVERRGVAPRPAPTDRCVVHAACMLWRRYAGSRKPRTASVMRMAATVAATSCTRTMRAPLMTQMTATASEPFSRSCLGRSSVSPMKSLFE